MTFFIFDRNHNNSFSKLSVEEKQVLLTSLTSFGVNYQDSLHLDPSLSFGLEIEFVSLMLSFVSNYIDREKMYGWQVKEEEQGIISFFKNGSLYGGEITTPKSYDKKNSWESIKIVLEFLKMHGALINEFCGGHIHIGKNILEDSLLYLERFIKLWIVFEDVVIRFGNQRSSGGRKYQIHAARVCGPSLYCYLNYHTKKLNYDSFSLEIPRYRLSSLSFRDFFREDGTIEFRNPDGTLDVVLWQIRVLFFGRLLMSVKNETNDFDLIDKMICNYNMEDYTLENCAKFYFNKALILADFIFDNNLDKAFFLKTYIKEETLIRKKGNIMCP